MLFLWVMAIGLFVFIFEVSAYWHVRNFLEEAAAQGAATAGTFDGDCGQAELAARAVAARSGSWASDIQVSCDAAGDVRVEVKATSWAVLFGGVHLTVDAVAPGVKER